MNNKIKKSIKKWEGNPYRILEVLSKELGWVSWEFFDEKYPYESFFLSDMERLEEDKFIESETQTYFTNVKEKTIVTRKVYRVSTKGYGFLNSAEAKDTNKLIAKLTKILIWIGFGALILSLSNLWIMILR